MVIAGRYQTLSQLEMQETAARANEQKFQAELVKELGVTDANPSDVLQKQAIIIQNMPPEIQQQYMATLQKKTPISFSFLMARLQLSGAIASPMEQRERDAETEKERMAIQQSKVEGKISEQEHGQKVEETRMKMKADEHKLGIDEKRLELKKEEAKIKPKDGSKK
jgi:hypothetical protein